MIDVVCIFDVMHVSVGVTVGALVSIAVHVVVAIVKPALIRMLIDVDIGIVVVDPSLIRSTIIIVLIPAVRLMILES